MSSSLEPDAESLLAVACPRCHAALAVGSDLIGATARCPQCGKAFLVPEPEPDRPAEPPARSGLDALVPDLPAADAVASANPELQFAEPVEEIETARGVIQLRRLTPQERAARRSRRNLLMLLGGISILTGIVLSFSRRSSRRP
jgi:hypothetical protein